jgi:transcriptional regulator with XRE-family HTH domain
MDRNQCRGARGLLNWTQAELAAESGVSGVTIRKFERGQSALRSATRRILEQTLEAAGITFTDGDEPGVKLRIAPLPPSRRGIPRR